MAMVIFASILASFSFLRASADESTPAPEAASERPPNILMIIVDDLNDWVGVLGGHPNAKTPNMDRLASQGMTFTRAYATAAICGPSRASVMTGMRPSTTGLYWQIADDDIKIAGKDLSDIRFLSEYFADSGYATIGIGKIFHKGAATGSFEDYAGRVPGFGPKPKTFMAWDSDKTNTDWGAFPAQDEDMIDYASAQWIKGKLRESHDRPFFMSVGFIRPHAPWFVPQKWFDLHPLEHLEMPPYLASDLEDLPEMSLAVHEVPVMPSTEWAIENEEWAKAVQGYLASVSFVDHYIGEVLDALESSPHADNTIVILWSDHGYHLGEKNRFAKHSLWEETARVPFIVKGPGVKAGEKNHTVVSLLDIYPTLVEMAGLPGNPRNEGVSLTPQLFQRAETLGRVAITTYGEGNHAVRNDQYRYIRFEDGSEELYDHSSDPNEWVNLAKDGQYSKIVSEMRRALPSVNAPTAPIYTGRAINDHFLNSLHLKGIEVGQ